MKISITSKKVEVTPAFREKNEKKLMRLKKFFKDEPEAQVMLTGEKDRMTMEVTIYSSGMIYRAKHTGYDLNEAMDRIVDVIERQIRKHKTRLEKRNKVTKDVIIPDSDNALSPDLSEDEFNIVKVKHFILKPMDAEEAILQMHLLGHQFFVFQNAETDKKSIVYKRTDGDYALIEI